jgi:hypothetical protein
MFSEKALFDTQVDVAKASTVSATSRAWDAYRRGEATYFPQEWILATVATLVGLVVYGLVVSQAVKLSVGNPGMDAGIADAIKVATVSVASVLVPALYSGSAIEFSQAWMMSTAMTMAGFFAFNVVVAPYIPRVDGHQATVTDLAKAAFTTAAVRYLQGGQFDNEFVMSLAGTLAGFALFHEVVAPRVFA